MFRAVIKREKLFQICACVISVRKAKHFDATTMFTYPHANMPLGQLSWLFYKGKHYKPGKQEKAGKNMGKHSKNQGKTGER